MQKMVPIEDSAAAPSDSEDAPRLDQIIDTMRKRISRGLIAPGTQLQEIALALEFGVSRPRIRDALLALQQRGLVERQRNHSAVVAKLDLKRVFETLDVRENLEGLCVRLATQNRPPESWQYLVDLFHGPMERYARENDFDSYLAEIENFRIAVVEATDNSVLVEMLDALRDRTRAIVDRTTMLPGRIELGLKELQLVVDAMRRGDAVEAERLRRANIASQREFVRRFQNYIL